MKNQKYSCKYGEMLRSFILRARSESKLIQHESSMYVIIPYWFMRDEAMLDKEIMVSEATQTNLDVISITTTGK